MVGNTPLALHAVPRCDNNAWLTLSFNCSYLKRFFKHSIHSIRLKNLEIFLDAYINQVSMLT